MTFIRDRRVIAALVATSCLAVPASAAADQLPSTYKSDAAQPGTVARAPYSLSTAATAVPPAEVRGGDTPADPNQVLVVPSAAPLLALAGAGAAVTRTRVTPRPGH